MTISLEMLINARDRLYDEQRDPYFITVSPAHYDFAQRIIVGNDLDRHNWIIQLKKNNRRNKRKRRHQK